MNSTYFCEVCGFVHGNWVKKSARGLKCKYCGSYYKFDDVKIALVKKRTRKIEQMVDISRNLIAYLKSHNVGLKSIYEPYYIVYLIRRMHLTVEEFFESDYYKNSNAPEIPVEAVERDLKEHWLRHGMTLEKG
ncbi:MAG: hypothetical protein ACTSUO_00865 [Candidatus Thorarchaeota archaeon]